MQFAILAGLALSIVLLVGGVAAMLVLRYRGRTVPTWLVRLVVVVLGLQSSLGGIVFIRQPLMLASLAFQTAVVVWFLWRGGRRGTTGILLVTTGLFGTLWWGFFLLQDLADSAELYEAVLWLWLAPSAFLVLAGGVLMAAGDRRVAKPVFPQAANLRRDPMPLGNALARESSIGPLPLASIVADGLALMVAVAAIALWGDLVPWPIVLIGATAAYTVISAELYYYALSPRIRRAWEGMAILGNPEMKRWKADTGTSIPTSPSVMRAWLRDVPDRPEIRWARAEMQATLGDLEAARQSAAEMPLRTDADRFEQRMLLAWIGWLDGGDEDFAALNAEAELIGDPGSVERLEAQARVTLARARDLATRGGDWKGPLEELRSQRGREPSAMLQGDLRRARYRAIPPVGIVLTGILVLLNNLAG